MSWECASCTLLNADDNSDTCDLCGAPRSLSAAAASGAAAATQSRAPSSSVAGDRSSVRMSTNFSERASSSHMSFGAILRAGPEAFTREIEEKKRIEKAKEAAKGGVFGVPLTTSAPPVLCDCMAYILSAGLETEGVFRIPGQQDVVDFLRADYEKHPDKDVLGENKGKYDVHDIATLFKTYFRTLPEPLIPLSHYNALMTSVRIKYETREDMVQAVSDVVHSIPSPERECFGFVITFLKKVAANSEVNKMSPANLATCFAPSLVRAPPDINPQQALMDMSSAIGALNILLQNPEDLPQPESSLVKKNTRFKPPMLAPPPGLVGAPPGLSLAPPPGL